MFRAGHILSLWRSFIREHELWDRKWGPVWAPHYCLSWSWSWHQNWLLAVPEFSQDISPRSPVLLGAEFSQDIFPRAFFPGHFSQDISPRSQILLGHFSWEPNYPRTFLLGAQFLPGFSLSWSRSPRHYRPPLGYRVSIPAPEDPLTLRWVLVVASVNTVFDSKQ